MITASNFSGAELLPKFRVRPIFNLLPVVKPGKVLNQRNLPRIASELTK